MLHSVDATKSTHAGRFSLLSVLCYQTLFLRLLFLEVENLTRHPWRGCEW